MKAAVVRGFKAPLAIEHLPTPVPGEGQVLVEIEASGLCHTDIHAARGDWPVKPDLPLIPGHEGVGIVVGMGPGVAGVSEGDRVAIPWLGWACGSCEYCVTGREALCELQRNTGYDVSGAFAEHAVADARFVGRVPDGIDPLDAAPLSCAGVTSYKAVKVSGARSSDLVAVFGIGGLGHLALQYAQIAGAAVVAVDVVESKLDLARGLGAQVVVNAQREDPALVIRALGGADAAIVTAVAARSFEQAYAALRRGGRVVFVALPPDRAVSLPIYPTVRQGTSVVGSMAGTRVDLAEVLELHAAGRTKVVRVTRSLDDVNAAIGELERGEVDGRVVFDLR